jgi:hypothetical protein
MIQATTKLSLSNLVARKLCSTTEQMPALVSFWQVPTTCRSILGATKLQLSTDFYYNRTTVLQNKSLTRSGLSKGFSDCKEKVSLANWPQISTYYCIEI